MLLWILLLPLVLADYYSILGLLRDALDRDIKKAYRNLLKKYHPDKNKDEQDAHRFVEINEAYDVLSNEEKRRLYDQYGEEGVKNGGPPPQNNGFDFFEHMFGGQFRQHHQGKRRGDDSHVEVKASLKEFYNGASINVRVGMQNICSHCKGSGSEDGKENTCTTCGGSGMRIVKRQLAPGMFQQFQTLCDQCHGKGKIVEHACHLCHGQGVLQQTREYDVHVPAGAPRGFVDRLEKEGNQHPDFEPGDLYVHVQETHHGNMGYLRRGDNLYRTEVLSLKEALAGGWERKIGFFDDEELVLKREKGEVVNNGEIEVIPGKGMPKEGGGEGNLYIEWLVIWGKNSKNLKDEL